MRDFIDDLLEASDLGRSDAGGAAGGGNAPGGSSRSEYASDEDAEESPVWNADYSTDDQDEIRRQDRIIEECVNNRIFFCEVVLGVDLEPWQREVLQSLDAGETRISIRSGNGAGKTMLIATVVLHYLLFRNDVKIPVTAPASSQLTDGLIPECHKWIAAMPAFLQAMLGTTSTRIVRKDSPENNFISFRTARKEKPEALAGIHAKHVMCAVDEASAVDEPVYEAAQGTLSTPGAIFLMISNPTRLSGYFYNSHHRLKKRWKTFHVTSFDTSRVDQEFVDTIRETYGLNSTQYKVKVLGDFPEEEEEALISRLDVNASFTRDVVRVGHSRIWGVDVGRGGDLSALVQRDENVISYIETKNYSDTMKTVAWVKNKWDELPEDERPESIYVDSIGIGAGVADRLRELDLPCYDVNVGESSAFKDKYMRLRDELWYGLKAWFESQDVKVDLSSLPNAKVMQDNFVDEVCAPLAIFTASGKNTVETKAQMKQRGYQSPNIADAACLTFAHDGAIMSGAYVAGGSKSWNKPLDYAGAPGVH